MSKKAQQKQIVFKIDGVQAFHDLMEDHKRLIVIDVHLAWCGPCNVMESNFRSIYFGLDDADNRIGFYTCDEESLPQEIASHLKFGALTCKPRICIFLVSSPLKTD